MPAPTRATSPREGFEVVRLMMVLSGMSPLFVLWGIRGIKGIDDLVLWVACGVLIFVPAVVLLVRLRLAIVRSDARSITVGIAEDHREHLLVYLVAVLLPLYDANLGEPRETAALLAALVSSFSCSST